jgi:hypothetical protein
MGAGFDSRRQGSRAFRAITGLCNGHALRELEVVSFILIVDAARRGIIGSLAQQGGIGIRAHTLPIFFDTAILKAWVVDRVHALVKFGVLA